MPIVAAVESERDARPVLEEAASLAEAYNTPVHVVHVSGQYESTGRVRKTAQSQPGEELDVEESRERARDRAARLAADVVPDVTPVGRVGYPAREIVAYADEQDARYVVIGGRKRSPVGKVLFGSVTQAVLLDADQPVVCVRVDD